MPRISDNIEASLSSISSKVRFSTVASGSERSIERLKLNERPLALLGIPKSIVLIPIRVELTVGVPLLLDMMDIADPGRGEGLGLGGPSESVSSEPEEIAWWWLLLMRMGLGFARGWTDAETGLLSP